MKRINVYIIVALLIAMAYLIYKIHINDQWNKNEIILFIVVVAVGIINASIVEYRRFKKKRGSEPN